MLICGFWLGSIFTTNRIRKQIFQIAKEKGITLEEEEPKIQKVPSMQIEKHGNLLYLFNLNKDNTFMCQGATVDELAEKLLHYNNIEVAYVRHGDNNLLFIKGKVESAVHES